jgi:hypothetical protein
MNKQDRLGRRRRPEQDRGLRPLHPLLPAHWTSKSIRIAMSQADWGRFEALVESISVQAPTQARAQGMVVSRLMDHARSSPNQGLKSSFDWMDWEWQKALRLLRSVV